MRRPHVTMKDLKRILMTAMMLCFVSVSVFADGQKGEKPPPKEKPPVVVVAPKPGPPPNSNGGEKRGGKKP
jgi:hypothetical protein